MLFSKSAQLIWHIQVEIFPLETSGAKGRTNPNSRGCAGGVILAKLVLVSWCQGFAKGFWFVLQVAFILIPLQLGETHWGGYPSSIWTSFVTLKLFWHSHFLTSAKQRHQTSGMHILLIQTHSFGTRNELFCVSLKAVLGLERNPSSSHRKIKSKYRCLLWPTLVCDQK